MPTVLSPFGLRAVIYPNDHRPAHVHGLVANWGWAIILLTLIVKAVFYPLTAASYRSMGKMKALSPRLERLKTQYGDDRVKFQQAVMAMDCLFVTVRLSLSGQVALAL